MCQGRRCPPLETSRQGERCSPLDTPPVRAVAIHPAPTRWIATARTGKTGTEICPGGRQISVPVFVQRRLGKAYTEPSVLVGDFRIGVRKLFVPSPYIWYNKAIEFSDGGTPHGHLV